MQIKKLFLIAIKDLRLIFRDPSALVLMLLAPFVLTIGMGALTGRFSGGTGSGISNIPVILVNEDKGLLGDVLVEVFQSLELVELVAPELMDDLQRAKALVDEDQITAVIYIPEGFTDSIIPSTETSDTEVVRILFYANPTQPTSAGVVRSILDQFINRVEFGNVSGQVIVQQLIENGLISPAQAGQVGQEISQEITQMDTSRSSITIQSTVSEDEGIEFDILAYMAPGMAIMFLMFTVTYGGRSLLVENYHGTLPRLLVAPTIPAYVLGGKAFGIFLTAVAQMAILIGGTSLMFRLEWGDTLGVILLILTAAFAATGWGMFFAAILKTPGQVAITGFPVMLLFGILGGSFFDLSMLPDWIQVVNKITPNAWAVDGFRILSFGGGLDDILTNILALVIMGIVLFVVASFWMQKSGLARK
jgi:ABC-2 type transport system permease protein